MFTGIVTDLGEVRSVSQRAGELHRLTIFCSYARSEIIQGASIACSGVCLTVVDAGEEDGRVWFAVDAAAETLRVTTAGRWRHGSKINLERPLKFGDELGGHLVAGHVDGIATVVAREDMTDMARFVLRAPAGLRSICRTKGLGRARWRLSDCQCRGSGYFFSACHSAYIEGNDIRSLAQGRRCQSRGRYHGPLRRTTDGNADVRPVSCPLFGHGPLATTAG